MIKISSRFIFAALAATAVLVSCTKEITPGKADADPKAPQTESLRTIAVSFAPRTKTALGKDGLTPEFTGKDEWIKVSNSENSEDCKVTVDNKGYASFKTSLLGNLKAVYPSTAAKMNGDVIEGVKVSSVQDGTFANANICMAEMTDEKANVLAFHNKTALFVITPPDGELGTITVKSLAPVVDGVARTGEAVSINTDGKDAAAQCIITVKRKRCGRQGLCIRQCRRKTHRSLVRCRSGNRAQGNPRK